MALADYDTAVEKIAALKAAMIDPTLVQIATSNFTTNQIIYPITRGFDIGGLAAGYNYDNLMSIPARIPSGIDLVVWDILLYINAADIIYASPIVTYQNRIAQIIDSDLKISNASVNSGTYGSMVLSLRLGAGLRINTKETYIADNNTALPRMIVIPNGNSFSGTANYTFEYIDLPVDW